jgi:hypothetical protein
MTDDEQAFNLRTRATWRPVMDMREAHAMLKERGGYITDLIKRPGSTQVWRYMARIARAFEGDLDFLDPTAAADYVRHSLGRSGSNSFLTELDAFPARRQRQPTELRDFPDRDLLKKAREGRKARQLALLKSGKPRAVICYGSRLAPLFAERLSIQWRPLGSFGWQSRKSGTAREKIIQHAEVQHDDGASTRAFLLPFFGQGQLSSDVLRQFVETAEFQRCRR